jgi:hypothetical protein
MAREEADGGFRGRFFGMYWVVLVTVVLKSREGVSVDRFTTPYVTERKSSI